MQKISFGNKEYIKASEIAKRFKYTQDYVGQLCRSKKVDARLVGRVWYVEPSSVTSYRKTKHKTQKTEGAKIKFNKKQPTRVSTPKSVAPVVRAKTAKTTNSSTPEGFAVPVSYQPDKAASIPVLTSPQTGQQEVELDHSVVLTTQPPVNPEMEPIEKPAKPKKIKIQIGAKKQTKFTSEKIPEISLSGKVKVNDLHPEELEEIAQNALAEKLESEKPVPTTPESLSFAEKVAAVELTKPEPEITPRPVNDDRVVASRVFTPTSVDQSTTGTNRWLQLTYILVSVVVSLLVAMLLLSAQSVSLVENGTVKTSVLFDLARISHILPQ